jgi:acetyltransferase-like isoleucine patch superfamily enzyme
VVNKDIAPGKLAVGMPARVIRDAPRKAGENERPSKNTEG